MLLAAAVVVLLGPEIVSEPLIPTHQPAGCGVVAVAAQADTTVVAWAVAPSTIVATRLDRGLLEIPGTRLTIERTIAPRCAAVATSGSESVLLWSEPAGERDDLYAARFDLSGQILDGPDRLLSLLAGTKAAIAWRGGTFLIAAGDVWTEFGNQPLDRLQWWEMGDWRRSFGTEGTTRVFDTVAPTQTAFALSTRAFTTPRWACVIGGSCGYTAAFTSLGYAVPHRSPPEDIDLDSIRTVSPATIACASDRCFMAWVRMHTDATMEIQGRWVDGAPTARLAFDPSRGASSIASASDGTRILLAWESGSPNSPQILALAVDQANVMPIVVAQRRLRPAVTSLGYSRFLVAYEIAEPGGAIRIGGRVITIDPPRRRIAR